jgi:hypothetical protein
MREALGMSTSLPRQPLPHCRRIGREHESAALDAGKAEGEVRLPAVGTGQTAVPSWMRSRRSRSAPRPARVKAAWRGSTRPRRWVWVIGAAHDPDVGVVRRHLGTSIDAPARTTAPIRALARRLQASDARLSRQTGASPSAGRDPHSCSRGHGRRARLRGCLCPKGRRDGSVSGRLNSVAGAAGRHHRQVQILRRRVRHGVIP